MGVCYCRTSKNMALGASSVTIKIPLWQQCEDYASTINDGRVNSTTAHKD